jgi:site-specific recombinase XerD
MVVMAAEIEPFRPAAPEPIRAEHVPWPRALSLFLDAKADSPHTRRAYGRHVEAAMAAMNVYSLTELSGAALAEWRAKVTSSSLAPGSQSQALAALRSFLKWSRALGLHRLPDDLIRETLKTPRATVRRPYNVLSEPEIASLLACAHSKRDRALIAVLLGGGLRAAELVNLDVSDLHEDQDGELALHVRAGKGRKDRVVPIRGSVARLLRTYLGSTRRRLGSDGPLFLSADPAKRRPDRRMSTRAVGYLVDRLCEQAGIEAKKISPHSCRHSYAIRALRGGANVVALQKLMGHANAATTSLYLDHLELDELRAAVPELPLDSEAA